MTQNAKLLAAGLAGGYLLGRTKKGKLALVLATYVLGKRKGLHPQQLLVDGLKKISDTPEFSQLEEQVRSELLAAGRSLATAAANRRLDSLSDALRDRTDALSRTDGADGASKDEETSEESRKAERSEETEDSDEQAETSPSDERADDQEPKRGTAEDAADGGDEGEEDSAPEPSPAKKAPARKSSAKKSAQKSTQGGSAAKQTADRGSRPTARKSTRPTGRR